MASIPGISRAPGGDSPGLGCARASGAVALAAPAALAPSASRTMAERPVSAGEVGRRGRGPCAATGAVVAGRCSVRLGSPTPPTTPSSQPYDRDRDGRLFRLDALPMLTPCLASPLTTPGGRARATRSSPGGAAGGASWVGSAASLAGARLDRHEELLELYQAQLHGLHLEVASLRECLTMSGYLRQETFLTHLHRHRFAAVLALHPLGAGADTSLLHVLQPRELALDVARGIGPPGVAALRVASSAAFQAVETVWADLREWFSTSIIVAGGFDGVEETCTVERFDPAIGAWELLPPMREPGSLMGAVSLAGRLLVCSGRGGKLYHGPGESFDPAAGLWAPMPALPTRRWCTANAVLGGKLYVCGGFDRDVELSVVEQYDPSVGTWSALEPMLTPRAGAAAVALGDKLYVCGGRFSNAVERFDEATNAWEQLPPMALARSSASSAVVRGKLYMCGGMDGRTSFSSADRFDPLSDTWEELPPLVESRAMCATAVVAGRIYLCGGCDGAKFLSSTERFDPDANTWTMLRPMSAPRAMAASAVLDGRLYVCGGHDGAEFRRSVERLDPERGEWELLPPMRGRRSAASAVAIWSVAPGVREGVRRSRASSNADGSSGATGRRGANGEVVGVGSRFGGAPLDAAAANALLEWFPNFNIDEAPWDPTVLTSPGTMSLGTPPAQ